MYFFFFVLEKNKISISSKNGPVVFSVSDVRGRAPNASRRIRNHPSCRSGKVFQLKPRIARYCREWRYLKDRIFFNFFFFQVNYTRRALARGRSERSPSLCKHG